MDKETKYHIIAGFARDKDDFNNYCLRSVFKQVAQDPEFMERTKWKMFFSHLSDAQMALCADKILGSRVVNFYYCDSPYFQVTDNPYGSKKDKDGNTLTFIQNLYISSMDQSQITYEILEKCKIKAQLFLTNEYKTFLRINLKIDKNHSQYNQFNEAVALEGRNCYGIAFLSTFLYFLYREINHWKIGNSVDIVNEEQEKPDSEKKKLNISIDKNDLAPVRLKYALEFSSHPKFINIVPVSNNNLEDIHLNISSYERPNSIIIDFYRYIAWPTEDFINKISDDKFNNVVISLGGTENNLPALYFINELRKQVNFDMCIPEEGDRANIFDVITHFRAHNYYPGIENNQIRKSLLLDSEDYVSNLNSFIYAREFLDVEADILRNVALIAKFLIRIENKNELSINHFAGMSAFLTKLAFISFLMHVVDHNIYREIFKPFLDFSSREIERIKFVKQTGCIDKFLIRDKQTNQIKIEIENVKNENGIVNEKKHTFLDFNVVRNHFDKLDLFNNESLLINEMKNIIKIVIS